MMGVNLTQLRLVFLAACPLVAQHGYCQQAATLLWKLTTPGQIESGPALAENGTIYVTCFETSWLCSFSPHGATNWLASLSSTGVSSPAIASDGTIYVGTDDGRVYAENPNGTRKWVFLTGGQYASSPAIGLDGTVYVTSFSSSSIIRLYAISTDGTTNWVRTLEHALTTPGSAQRSSPAIGVDGTIYVGSVCSHFYAFSPAGTTNWIASLNAVTYCSPAIRSDGSVCIGADSGTVYSFSPGETVQWTFSTGRFVESTPVFDNAGTMYFGSGDGNTYAVDQHGNRQWTYPTGGVSGAPAIAADGTIYIGSYSANALYALNSSGSNLWTFATPISVFSSPAIGPDGTVYFGAGSTLYALQGTMGLLGSSWPMFARDLKHTARSIQRGIHEPIVLSDGNVVMNLTIETGLTYRVQASTNLIDWQELTNFQSLTITNQFIDESATNFPERFYRLETP